MSGYDSRVEAHERDTEQPFVEHLREFKRRMVQCVWWFVGGFVVAIILYSHYVQWLIEPFGMELKTLSPAEGFMMMVKISSYGAVLVAFPAIALHAMKFLGPGLSDKERKVLTYSLGGSVVLGVCGFALSWYQILPYSLRFLAETNPENVTPEYQFSLAIAFAVKMVLAFILLFQLPLVMLGLMACDLVSRGWFMRMGRYIIVLIFVVSAVLTPPEPISQLGLAVPLIFLYYLSILLAKILGIGDEDFAEDDAE